MASSIASFIPQLWEESIIAEYTNISIADMITATPSSVSGSCSIFNRSNLTNGLQDYTGSVDYEDIKTTDVKLFYDIAKYAAFKIGDIDKAQAVNGGALMQKSARDMAQAIKDAIDTSVFNEAVTGAATENKITDAALDVTKAYDDIVDLGTALDKKNVPASGRFVIAGPDFVNLLAKDTRVIDNTNVLPNGVVSGMEVNGMQVIKSNLVPANKVIALNSEAIGYGKQIEELEAMRLENSFSDAVRMLVNYGVKTLRPEAIALLTYTVKPASKPAA